MDRNEKIAAAMTAAVTVGSATLFAIKRYKGRNNTGAQVEGNNPIKAVITLANTISA